MTIRGLPCAPGVGEEVDYCPEWPRKDIVRYVQVYLRVAGLEADTSLIYVTAGENNHKCNFQASLRPEAAPLFRSQTILKLYLVLGTLLQPSASLLRSPRPSGSIAASTSEILLRSRADEKGRVECVYWPKTAPGHTYHAP